MPEPPGVVLPEPGSVELPPGLDEPPPVWLPEPGFVSDEPPLGVEPPPPSADVLASASTRRMVVSRLAVVSSPVARTRSLSPSTYFATGEVVLGRCSTTLL